MKIIVKTCESKKGKLFDCAVLVYGKREMVLTFDANVCSVLSDGMSLLAQEACEHVVYDLVKDDER